MKLALFRNPLSNIEMVSGPESDRYYNVTGMIRISGWAEVEFPPIEAGALKEKLAQVDEEIKKEEARTADKLKSLKTQRAVIASALEPRFVPASQSATAPGGPVFSTAGRAS